MSEEKFRIAGYSVTLQDGSAHGRFNAEQETAHDFIITSSNFAVRDLIKDELTKKGTFRFNNSPTTNTLHTKHTGIPPESDEAPLVTIDQAREVLKQLAAQKIRLPEDKNIFTG